MNTTYEVKYHTHNVYDANVRESFFSFLIMPYQNETQSVRHISFANSLKAEVFHHLNSYGFQMTSLYSAAIFKDFLFEMTATVEKSPVYLPMNGLLSVEEEQRLLAEHNFYIDNHLYLGTSAYTLIEAAFHNKLLFRKEDQTVYDYLLQLNSFIYQMLEYDPEPTHVHTTVSEVIELGRGVCQDYAHLFIGITRLNKIPCRYVSGYLNQGLNLTGTAVMHAWVEAFIPGQGWHGFDPTNNLLADIHYIKVAHGSDYNDCSPIKGMLRTSGGQKTNYGVEIKPQFMAESAQ